MVKSYWYIATADGIKLWLEDMAYAEANKVYNALKSDGHKPTHFQAVVK